MALCLLSEAVPFLLPALHALRLGGTIAGESGSSRLITCQSNTSALRHRPLTVLGNTISSVGSRNRETRSVSRERRGAGLEASLRLDFQQVLLVSAAMALVGVVQKAVVVPRVDGAGPADALVLTAGFRPPVQHVVAREMRHDLVV